MVWGGRNQELALAAAEQIGGIERAAVFSVGSDGTDGPTDAAGGFADSTTSRTLLEKGLKTTEVLGNNDSCFSKPLYKIFLVLYYHYYHYY